MKTTLRKLDHILIAYEKNVEAGTGFLEEIKLVHQALPEINMNEVSLETVFIGKKLEAPLMITGITGGHPLAGDINKILAQVVEKHKIAIGVGSQRAALENPEYINTYKVVRENAPNVPVIANIGAPQILENDPVALAEKSIEMIDADAIAVHLNPGQEAFQPEGDTNYKGVLKNIKKIVEEISVPVIVKETGSGLSLETVIKLVDIGVKIVDVSGSGGTNWIKVEMYRAEQKDNKILAEAANTFSNWGIPTAASVIEARHVSKDLTIIASGGIRTGLDIAKVLALGADYAGIALPALKKALISQEELDRYITKLKTELKAALFLTGSKDIKALKRKPIILGRELIDWLVQRGIDYNKYLNEERS